MKKRQAKKLLELGAHGKGLGTPRAKKATRWGWRQEYKKAKHSGMTMSQFLDAIAIPHTSMSRERLRKKYGA
jgi:hypothetical protein